MAGRRFVGTGFVALAVAAVAGACANGGSIGPGLSGGVNDAGQLGDGGSSSGSVDDSPDQPGNDSDTTASSSSGTTSTSTSGSGSGSGSGSTTTSSSSGGTTSSGTSSGGDGGGAEGGSSTSGGTSSGDGGMAPTGFSVLYEVGTGDSPTMSSYIGAELQVSNGSTGAVQVSDLTVRYYYTDEVHMTPTFTDQWAHITTSGAEEQITFTATFAAISPAVPYADTYVEFSFPGVTSPVNPGQSVQFSWRLAAPDPATEKYNQSNDYSFSASKSTLTSWNHVVLFIQGNVAWGVVPM